MRKWIAFASIQRTLLLREQMLYKRKDDKNILNQADFCENLTYNLSSVNHLNHYIHCRANCEWDTQKICQQPSVMFDWF